MSKFYASTKRARYVPDELVENKITNDTLVKSICDRPRFSQDEYLHITIDGNILALQTRTDKHAFVYEHVFSSRVKKLTLRNVNEMYTYGLFRHLRNLESLVIENCTVPIVVSDSFCPLMKSIHIIKSRNVRLHRTSESEGFTELKTLVVDPNPAWDIVQLMNLLFVHEEHVIQAIRLWKRNERDLITAFDRVDLVGDTLRRLAMETESNVREWIGHSKRTIEW